MRLSEATWTAVADLDTDLALLPVGSTEQHGPHAPLGTDALNAESIAEAGAAAFDGDVLVGPTIPVGVAEEHRAFDGTLWVSPDTFRAYVRETIESLAHHGFDRIVVVNGHGGNVEALAECCRRVSRGGDAYAVSFTWFDAVGEHSSDMGHGGPLETALLRHTHPELVRENRIEEARDGGSDHWGEWVSGVNLAHDSDEFTDNGVVGDPTDGDAERGEKLESLAADALASLVAAVETRNLD
ncbi:creatininase [Haloferax mucosum ATCC BAA-1512]|uniref:Creatininase n=1 Tax=Haloferax mucosum ATCC BAA-1512 TaxID=662479 RepID=M0IDD5_9EURY|nr:creatininase family protein [Haloferax mucosum]ELZ94771.1 creatininase [Haloferax mucosum ATCC BAA-1512]